jgi:hypothetical protein
MPSTLQRTSPLTGTSLAPANRATSAHRPARTTPSHQDLFRQTGTTRRADVEQMVNLFQYPGLITLGRALEESDAAHKDARGRKALYSPRLLLGVAACARVSGSLASALSALSDGDAWARCVAAYSRIPGAEPVPDAPPTRDHIVYWNAKVAARPGLIRALEETFTDISVRQARSLGNLPTGHEPQWAGVDVRHMIEGDGTIVKPFSDVREVTNPLTGTKMLIGSRARQDKNAKIQREVRLMGADGKSASGINFVSFRTRTPFGSIVLGVRSELGAEQWAALDLIDQIVSHAGDGVHTVVYDGALTGWHVDYLMATHRIQVLGKVAASGAEKARDAAKALEARADSLAAERSVDTKHDYVKRVLRNNILEQMFAGNRPHPVGTSIYPRNNPRPEDSKYEVTHGHYEFLTAEHDDAHGRTCSHDLVMDDGALFVLEIDELNETPVKGPYLRCDSVHAIGNTAGSYGREMTYQVPCGRGTFTYTSTWHPQNRRFHRDDAEKDRAPADAIGWRLRPVPQFDQEPFLAGQTARNISESHNAWFKRSLPGKSRKRAASITRAGQELDFLLAGVVNNSNTWAASRH